MWLRVAAGWALAGTQREGLGVNFCGPVLNFTLALSPLPLHGLT